MTDKITVAVDLLLEVPTLPRGSEDGGPGKIHALGRRGCPSCFGVGHNVERVGIGWMKVACILCDGSGDE